jgi:DNA-binding PadR family transcriptional regulator
MTNVFTRGRLRLYMLKLLDEEPHHGYELIRLLEERFQGSYVPSPGTIYPRLEKLVEEGLLTSETVGDRRVYRSTPQGHEEVVRRADELARLETDIEESVQRLALDVRDEVRESAMDLRRRLREEARAAGERGHIDQARAGYRPVPPPVPEVPQGRTRRALSAVVGGLSNRLAGTPDAGTGAMDGRLAHLLVEFQGVVAGKASGRVLTDEQLARCRELLDAAAAEMAVVFSAGDAPRR